MGILDLLLTFNYQMWNIQNIQHFFQTFNSREFVSDRMNVHQLKATLIEQDDQISHLMKELLMYSQSYTESLEELNEWEENYIKKAHGHLSEGDAIEWMVLTKVHNYSKTVFPEVCKILREVFQGQQHVRECFPGEFDGYVQEDGRDSVPNDFKFSQYIFHDPRIAIME